MNQVERGPDGGPIYTETNLDNFIAEPFNAITAVVFLGIALFWMWRLRGSYRHYLFLAVSAPVLAIGGIGGTLYHAFRVSPAALLMDWLPIAILCVAASIYFLLKLVDKWYWGLLYFLGFFGLIFLNYTLVPPSYAINTGYAMNGLMILIPLVGFLIKTHWKHARWVALALAAFALAIASRSLDKAELLPIGTHFLWHTFGAIACHAMFTFLFYAEKPESQQPEKA